jgi:hypothetical protein
VFARLTSCPSLAEGDSHAQDHRHLRVHIDPAQDGAERVNDLGDEVRREFYARIGLTDLLSPTQNT